jgi:hypothetical protein
VSPTAVGEEKGSRDPRVRRGRQWGVGARRRRDIGCVEGGSGEPRRDDGEILGASRETVGCQGRDGGGILGASREALGSWGEMPVGDAGEKQI